ncbi:MAG: hypothetical protein JW861_01745 [Bacteroidales bacterium]|nr:hypothetical protein [Bacteroidales bacterium]
MEIKKFRRQYDLELIPASQENIIIGTLVWDPLFGKPQLDHNGMPENIYNAFLDANIMDQTEWKSSLDALRTTALVEAHFAERTVELDTETAIALENPQIGKLSSQFNLGLVRKFTFGDLQARAMDNLQRVRIDSLLELLKKNNWDDYDGNIRRVFLITELYYGRIKIVIDTQVKAELEAAIPKANLELTSKTESELSTEYTFSHKNVPFAMRIEKVKGFNG